MTETTEGQDLGSILVVDDTPANLRLLAGMLKDQGYKVRPAPNGRLALQAAAKDPPDLILLDINMPEMNGYEVCEKLKEDEVLAPIPVIFISALTETMDKVKAFHSGGVDYVTKPFQFEEVQARVEAHLNLFRLKQEVEAQYEQLKELQDLRDSLTHMIVHDLRSPLTGILASLQLIQMMAGDRLEKEEMEDVDRALQATRQLVDMVSALLDVNRMESGEMPLSLKDTDLGGLANAALETLGGLTKNRDVGVANDSEAVTASVDEDLMRRVMANLVGNALKFTPQDGSVKLRVLSKEGGFRVEVQDTGPGIPEDFRTKIFEKFGQVEAREQKKKHSTGLGLAFCALAVEAHGGEIGVDSVMGEGSTFWFEVPGS
jgi:signal transduction histidine kinase